MILCEASRCSLVRLRWSMVKVVGFSPNRAITAFWLDLRTSRLLGSLTSPSSLVKACLVSREGEGAAGTHTQPSLPTHPWSP